MTTRVERWLSGPRGRSFVAFAASIRNPAIAFEYLRPMDARRTEDADALQRAMESVDPHALGSLSDREIAIALGQSVESAHYWQEPWHDRLLGRPVFDDVLARLAAPLAAHPATQAWSDPVDLDNQVHVEWQDLPRAALDGFAEILAEDHRYEVENERQKRPTDPNANWTGRWWSIPPWTLPVTSSPTPFAGAALLMASEDGPYATAATVRPVTVRQPVRVLELRSAEDFAALVASAPLEVRMSKRQDWYRATGAVEHWCIARWDLVAHRYDAIHLTTDAYLETAGRALPSAGGATVMAGWEPDTTRWLAERIAPGDGRRWYLDEQHQGEHLWYPADNAPT